MMQNFDQGTMMQERFDPYIYGKKVVSVSGQKVSSSFFFHDIKDHPISWYFKAMKQMNIIWEGIFSICNEMIKYRTKM